MKNQQDHVIHEQKPAPRVIRLFGKEIPLPQSRGLRIAIGVGLCFLGLLGFLPVLGFWMIPLGILVLSYEFAMVRRFRRRLIVWWERRRRRGAAVGQAKTDKSLSDRV
ncbi:MAG: hypothetical protein KF874_01205 [Rhizobiaceae bacterium]|nr:hypothetical protein [Rhizobiaceae bacterium]